MITEKQKAAVMELCRYVENFCKENDLSAVMSVTASEEHPDGLEQVTSLIVTGKGEHVMGSISGAVKANKTCLHVAVHGADAGPEEKGGYQCCPILWKFEHELMKDNHKINSGMKRKTGKRQKRSDRVSGAFTGQGLYGQGVYMRGGFITGKYGHEHE